VNKRKNSDFEDDGDLEQEDEFGDYMAEKMLQDLEEVKTLEAESGID
jgi:hypothetical protein